MRGWFGDLVLGLRLAAGGGRSSLARFVLSTVGIAIGVGVLLVGASIGNMAHQHEVRDAADSVGVSRPVDGVGPLYWSMQPTEFRGERIEVVYVYAEGDNHPLPKGVDRLPAPGEMLPSPALAELLSSPDAELLRPRLPGEVIGTLGQAVVPEPDDLLAYVGADPSFAGSPNAQRVYQFDGTFTASPMPVDVLVVVLIGAVVLLLPVFIFVSSSSRIAGAERDRRLSALRLVGADSRQVRRIAAAEGLVSAVAGLVVGAGVFLLVRTFAEEAELFGLRVYRSDVVPDPVLTVLIVLAVPALAVLTALFALRRTIIEPLGVVRQARPVRRRLWWRLTLVVAGVALLITGGGAGRGSDGWALALTAGAALLLVGVPVLLPWLVERVVGRLRGGPSSWQLAVRRLQLDSGTPARVVGGVAVVLAGAIALQSIVMTVEGDLALPAEAQDQPEPTIEVTVEEADLAGEVVAELEAVPAVRGAHVVRGLPAFDPDLPPDGAHPYLSVMDCAAVRDLAGIDDCTDGDVMSFGELGAPAPKPGSRLEFREYGSARDGGDHREDDYEVTGVWTVPEVRELPLPDEGDVWATIVTPGAIAGLRLPDLHPRIRVDAGQPSSDELEQIRNAVAPFTWRTHVFAFGTVQDLTAEQQTFLAVRNGLYAGSVFTLMLAGVSLLVLALEHIRERRRPLAVLVATGVPQGVLARSLLWQVVLPIAIGVVVAVLTGVGLAWLVLRITDESLAVDWLGVGLLSAGAAALSVLVTAMTLPFLRSATRLTSLRTE